MPINPKIDTLKARVQQGEGIVNLYDFELVFGNNQWIDADTSRDISDLIQDVSFPARTYSKQPVYYGGPLKNFPYIATYSGELNITFLLTKKSRIYNAFHEWNDYIINQNTNFVSYHDDYVLKQMEMIIRKPNNVNNIIPGLSKPIAKFRIYDVWPESLTEIPMTNTSLSDYVRFGVVFSYRRWEKVED